MLETMSRDWWALALRGAIAIVLGVIAFMHPSWTVGALIFLFGIYAFVDGLVAMVAGARLSKQHRQAWPALGGGLFGIVLGAIAMYHPITVAFTLIYIVAVWAILTGVIAVAIAIELRKHVENEWLMGLSGGLSILFGVILASIPNTGIVILAWTVGGYALVFGITMVALAFRLRNFGGSGGYSAPLTGSGRV
jgi:uncharacterized membrane protein HdeD (DUF308 family)